MIHFKCSKCDHLQTRQSTTMKVVDGKVRMTGDVCEQCGEKCEISNPKTGVPNLLGFDKFGTSKQ